MPRFFVSLLCLWIVLPLPVQAAEDIATYRINGSDYSTARDALFEVIEAEGLVVGVVLPFSQMLQRTAGEGALMPFDKAEIMQFCSSGLAWQMVQEDAEQLALCPLSIALYSNVGGAEVVLAYRLPGGESPGRRRANELLRRIATRTVELARLRW